MELSGAEFPIFGKGEENRVVDVVRVVEGQWDVIGCVGGVGKGLIEDTNGESKIFLIIFVSVPELGNGVFFVDRECISKAIVDIGEATGWADVFEEGRIIFTVSFADVFEAV